MTPIQELSKFLAEKYEIPIGKTYWTNKEKEFAKQCFEAGYKYYEDCHFEYDTTDFEQFYKQISKNK